MKLTFEVTAKDIRDGKPCAVQNCPIYLGIKRVNKDILSISDYEAHFKPNEWFKLPKVLMEFIAKFDDGLKVKPFKGTFNFRRER